MMDNVKIGGLYHFHIHYGTRDFPQTLLCLQISGDWFSGTIGEFLDVEKLKTIQFELTPPYDKRFVELEDK